MSPTEGAIASIAECEGRLRAAVLAADVAALDALLADVVVFVDQAGRVLTKAMDLETHRSGRLRVTRLEFSEPVSRDLGEAAVVVVVRAAVAGTFGGAPFAGEYCYTRVWHRRAAGWQVVAAHCSAIA
jgi:ketosteroid isomerase-like protein